MIPATKQEALRTGATRYLGRPCKQGHSGVKYTNGSSCVECLKLRNRGWKARNPGKVKQSNRRAGWTRAGLPVPTRPEPKACELCGRPPNSHGVLHLDHDHKTGKFRGWLCHSCNVGLGHFRDDVTLLESAAHPVSVRNPLTDLRHCANIQYRHG